jgi:hypothetical protein
MRLQIRPFLRRHLDVPIDLYQLQLLLIHGRRSLLPRKHSLKIVNIGVTCAQQRFILGVIARIPVTGLPRLPTCVRIGCNCALSADISNHPQVELSSKLHVVITHNACKSASSSSEFDVFGSSGVSEDIDRLSFGGNPGKLESEDDVRAYNVFLLL